MADFYNGLLSANGVFLAFSIAAFVAIFIEVVKEETKKEKNLKLLKYSAWAVYIVSLLTIGSTFFALFGFSVKALDWGSSWSWAWVLFCVTVSLLFVAMSLGLCIINKIINNKYQ